LAQSGLFLPTDHLGEQGSQPSTKLDVRDARREAASIPTLGVLLLNESDAALQVLELRIAAEGLKGRVDFHENQAGIVFLVRYFELL
jgi:hypothetical protein